MPMIIRLATAGLAALLVTGCLGHPAAPARSAMFDYDPGADPITNPDSLFAPFDPERADTEATINRYSLDQPTSLNPLFIRAWTDGFLYRLLFDPIAHRAPDLTAEWNPAMVDEVEELEGGLVHRIKLHAGMRWHDGAPVTSEDVRFSLEAIADDNVPAVDYKYKAAEIEEIRIIDDITFDVVHRQVSALRIDNLYFPIVPAHILNNPEERAADPTLRTSPYYNRYLRELGIGNGPFRFVEWIHADRVVVERWEDYHHDKPPIRRQAITTHSDRNAALLQFRKGQLDDIWLTVQQHGSQTNDEDFHAAGVKAWGPRWMQAYIGWQQGGNNHFFGDVRVRRAMAHAYDAERVLRQVSWNVYTRSNGMFPPTHWSHNPDVQPLEYDLDKAAALLDEAGWKTNPDDGWRYKEIDGEQVRFHFMMNLAQSFVDARRMVDIYRDDLRRIGVSFDTEIQENASRSPLLIQHEMIAHVDTYQVFADPDIWRNFFHTEAIENGRNYDSYSNPKVDELFDRSRMELDRDRRAELLRELQAHVQADQPALFLWNYSTTWGFSKRMRGVELGPAGVTAFVPGTRAWWVEREE
ncbi:MAG: ABC transporter substrate-binding protein [Acidobacteriota bacterium]|nr:ABC transporter substrate-binding protein [Acidobacteriota bacterium]